MTSDEIKVCDQCGDQLYDDDNYDPDNPYGPRCKSCIDVAERQVAEQYLGIKLKEKS